jgi:hypothetical protein
VTRQGARVGDVADPAGELAVEVVERAEAPGGEEGVAEVLDHPLDLALLVRAIRRAGLGRVVIVPGQLEHARVEADVIADAVEDDALEIVVEDRPRDAPQSREGFDVAAQEALQRLVQGEAGVDGARPRQHEDEARQQPAPAADRQGAEIPPVDLGLLAGQRLQAQVRFGARRGPHRAHPAPDLDRRAREAALPDHRVQPRGAQTRVLLQRRQ